MKELTIVKELQDLIPALTSEEYNLLEQSILKEGVRDPIIIFGDMVVDGHNRYSICKKHNIEFKTVDREFIDLDEVKIFIIENQLGRRNISKFVRGELALDLADIKSVEALKKKSEEMKKLNEEKWKTWREENETPVGKAISKVLDEHKTKKRNYAKPNKIYIVLDKQNDKIKIGCSKYPEERVKETILKHIPDATIMYIFNGDISIEKEIHRELDEYRLHQEWFRYDESNKNDVEKVLDLYRSVQTDRIDALQYASEISNVGRTSISKIKKIKDNASEEIIQKLREGSMSINEAHKEIKTIEKEIKKKEQVISDKKYKDVPIDNVYHGKFQDICNTFDPESIDHIITDPPYPKEFLPLWSDLSEMAEKVLKPGGFCICYAGKYYLPEFINRLSEHLDFYWQCILLHTGHLAGVHPVKMNTGYKPILIFQKPPRTPQRNYIKDVIIGSGREKGDYEWQQSVNELTQLIEGFTNTGDIILDPMAGTGSVGLGCYKNKRQFILIEENEDRVNIIKRRLSNEL